jgi:hypothetical protein
MTARAARHSTNGYSKPIETLTNLTGDGVILEGVISAARRFRLALWSRTRVIPAVSSAVGVLTVYVHETTVQVPYNVGLLRITTVRLTKTPILRVSLLRRPSPVLANGCSLSPALRD